MISVLEHFIAGFPCHAEIKAGKKDLTFQNVRILFPIVCMKKQNTVSLAAQKRGSNTIVGTPTF